MNTRKIGQVLLIALPIAATSFLGAGYIKTAPASGLQHSTIALADHRLECTNGTVTGWLLVRFDPPLSRAPDATLAGHRPLSTWLTMKDGMQWVAIGGKGPAAQQPIFFVWQSGVEMRVKLPSSSRVIDWTVHRDTEKPDSPATAMRRILLAGGTFVLLLLSVVATLLAQKIFEAPEELDTRRFVRLLIDACEFSSPAETEQGRRILRAVVLDGQSLDAGMATVAGSAKQKRLLAILAVGKLKAKLRLFHEELSVFLSRLERT